MKTKVLFAICLLMSAFAFGQNETTLSPKELGEVKVTPPEFRGVKTAIQMRSDSQISLINQYLIENVIYPENAGRCCFQGTEVVQLTINTNGEISKMKVINSVCPEIDNEFVRVLEGTSGMWSPGYNNGNAVEMEKEISLVFFVPYNKFRTVNEIFKARATKYFNEGNQYLLVKKNPKKALKSFEKAMVYLPYESALLFSRGLAKHSLNDIEGAEQDWNRMNNLAEIGTIQNNIELIAENYRNIDGYKQFQKIENK
jgi:hypothetical protein